MSVSGVVGRVTVACALVAAFSSASRAQLLRSGLPTPPDKSVVAPVASVPLIPEWPLPSDPAFSAKPTRWATAAKLSSGPSPARIIIGVVVGGAVGTIVAYDTENVWTENNVAPIGSKRPRACESIGCGINSLIAA
jgi:hypothetical protein